MLKLTALIVALTTLSITGCKKDDAKSSSSSSTATKPADPADPTPAPAAKPAAVAPISLDAAGADWKGFSLQGPSGAQISDNGAGGVVVNFADNTMVQLTPADTFDAKQFKTALTANAKSVTFPIDTADDLSFVTETDMGGTLFKGYGFNVIVSAGSKKVTCGSTYDDQATADRIKAICKSLAKS